MGWSTWPWTLLQICHGDVTTTVYLYSSRYSTMYLWATWCTCTGTLSTCTCTERRIVTYLHYRYSYEYRYGPYGSLIVLYAVNLTGIYENCICTCIYYKLEAGGHTVPVLQYENYAMAVPEIGHLLVLMYWVDYLYGTSMVLVPVLYLYRYSYGEDSYNSSRAVSTMYLYCTRSTCTPQVSNSYCTMRHSGPSSMYPKVIPAGLQTTVTLPVYLYCTLYRRYCQ